MTYLKISCKYTKKFAKFKKYSYLCKSFVEKFDCLQPRKKTLKRMFYFMDTRS